MSFDPNILGAFITGSVLTYIARNKSYAEPEQEQYAEQYPYEYPYENTAKYEEKYEVIYKLNQEC